MTNSILLLAGAGILVGILLLAIYGIVREVAAYYKDKD